MQPQALSRWIAGLLAISAIAFAFAIGVEHRESEGKGAQTEQVGEARTEAGEVSEHNEASEVASDRHSVEGSEQLLGINLESPWLIWGFVAISLALAAAVLRLSVPALALTVLVAGLAALLDLREVINQLGVKNLVAVLALLVALAHSAAAVLAIIGLNQVRTRQRGA